jgi:hypothetical protein
VTEGRKSYNLINVADPRRPRLVELDAQHPELGRPIQTPLAEWQLSWDEEAIDVSGVTSVWIEADVVFRPRAQMHLSVENRVVPEEIKPVAAAAQSEVAAPDAESPSPVELDGQTG